MGWHCWGSCCVTTTAWGLHQGAVEREAGRGSQGDLHALPSGDSGMLAVLGPMENEDGDWRSLVAGWHNAKEARAGWASSQSLTSALQLSPHAVLSSPDSLFHLIRKSPLYASGHLCDGSMPVSWGSHCIFLLSAHPFFIPRLPSLIYMLEGSGGLWLPGSLITRVQPPVTCQDVCMCTVEPSGINSLGQGQESLPVSSGL